MRAKRRDDNEEPLVELARSVGAWMIKTEEPTDWIMWWRGWHLVEVKNPNREGWESEYTPNQKIFRIEAEARGAKLITWREESDVLKTLGGVRAA